MAAAKKCDRCGKFYEKNNLYHKHIRNEKTPIDGVCMTTRSNDHVDYMDLCDDCIHKLGLFLAGRELMFIDGVD